MVLNARLSDHRDRAKYLQYNKICAAPVIPLLSDNCWITVLSQTHRPMFILNFREQCYTRGVQNLKFKKTTNCIIGLRLNVEPPDNWQIFPICFSQTI